MDPRGERDREPSGDRPRENVYVPKEPKGPTKTYKE